MDIRPLTHDDLAGVSALCLQAFMASIASSLPQQGIDTFRGLAAATAFGDRLAQDNLMRVAEHDGRLAGMIELKQGRHVAMLFIAPDQQRKGIGRRLVEAAIAHARADTLTVSAALSSVPAYQAYGFRCSGEVATSAGLVYQPMTLDLQRAA